MKKLIIVLITLAMVGCADSQDQETTPDDLTRIQIDLLHDKCVKLVGEAGELDCFKEYSEALSTELNDYIGVKIYQTE